MALNTQTREKKWFPHPWALELEDPKHVAFVQTPSRAASDELAQIPSINNEYVISITSPLESTLHFEEEAYDGGCDEVTLAKGEAKDTDPNDG